MSVPPAMYSAVASLRPAWAWKARAVESSRGRSSVNGCMAQPHRAGPVVTPAASWMATQRCGHARPRSDKYSRSSIHGFPAANLHGPRRCMRRPP